MRSESEVNRAVDLYADTVTRICMVYLKDHHDTQDIFQEVFLKYALSDTLFKSEEHEKAWIIRVTVNKCKDLLKSFFKSRTVSVADMPLLSDSDKGTADEYADVIKAVMSLPQKYRIAVYLYYYEDYTAVQIAEAIGKNTNTVYTLLARAKKMLKEKLRDYGD